MSVSFKTDNVEISAVRDRAMFNTFAGNQSYVIKGVGDELALTYSSSSFVVSIGTGEAVICGGSTLAEGTNEITLSQNQNGYIVIRVDLTQVGENICQFKSVSSLVQENINDEGYVYDFPLAQYTTNGNGVSSLVDTRVMKDNLYIKTINGNTPNNEGNIAINTGVLTINNTAPSSNGNLNINAGDGLTRSGNTFSIDANAYAFTSGTLLSKITGNPKYNTFIKTGSVEIDDFPEGYKSSEATIFVIRTQARISVLWTQYSKPEAIFVHTIYNGSWLVNSAWLRVNVKPYLYWTNPNTNVQFDAQDVGILPLYQYSQILIVYKMGTDLHNYYTQTIIRDVPQSYRASMTVGADGNLVWRIATLSSLGYINFGEGRSRTGIDNTKMIPWKIYLL